MTNTELLDLLRRARKVADAVVTDARSIAFAQWSPEQHRAEAVRDRIDKALAERQDKPPCSCGQPYPCMKGCPDCCHSQGYLGYCQGDRHAERQDSALAERQDSAKDVVKWLSTKDGTDQICSLPSGEILYVYLLGGVWHYSIAEMRVRAPYGYCATETEAKSAAIAAARGMK
jgi:hypothetical protein